MNSTLLNAEELTLVNAFKTAVKAGLEINNPNSEPNENMSIDVMNSRLFYSDDVIEVEIFDKNGNMTALNDLPDQHLYEGAKQYQKEIAGILAE